MIHAARELVDAMSGREPASDSSTEGAVDTMAVCGARRQDGPTALASRHWPMKGAEQDSDDVDCPACLALMAEARGPERTAELLVYADQLDERGESVGADALRTAVLFVPGESAARRKTA